MKFKLLALLLTVFLPACAVLGKRVTEPVVAVRNVELAAGQTAISVQLTNTSEHALNVSRVVMRVQFNSGQWWRHEREVSWHLPANGSELLAWRLDEELPAFAANAEVQWQARAEVYYVDGDVEGDGRGRLYPTPGMQRRWR